MSGGSSERVFVSGESSERERGYEDGERKEGKREWERGGRWREGEREQQLTIDGHLVSITSKSQESNDTLSSN